MGLAIMTELPLVIVNSQRGGPSTGLPTKTEQSDLYQAVYGRNGDAPMPVIAARSAADCFEVAIEAVRIATTYMTPVMLLTDGYIANAAEPWKVPDTSSTDAVPGRVPRRVPAEGKFLPYARDEKLARPWVKPGTPGLLHRIGGIEKARAPATSIIRPATTQAMTDIRRRKVAGHRGARPGGRAGRTIAASWSWSAGASPSGRSTRRCAARGGAGVDVSHIHIRHIWPMPANLGDLLRGYDHVLVPEMNTGQLKTVLRDQFLVDARPLNKVSGQPFPITEIEAAIAGHFGRDGDGGRCRPTTPVARADSGHDDGSSRAHLAAVGLTEDRP